MNHFEAVKLLDEVRNGQNHTPSKITTALELTGDITAFGLVGNIYPDICGTGLGEWRSSPKGWTETIFDTPI